MKLTAMEAELLTALVNCEADQGEYVSFARLKTAVGGDSGLIEAARSLEDKRLLRLDATGAATATEAGIAALKSM